MKTIASLAVLAASAAAQWNRGFGGYGGYQGYRQPSYGGAYGYGRSPYGYGQQRYAAPAPVVPVAPVIKEVTVEFKADESIQYLTASRCELIQNAAIGSLEMPVMGVVEFNQEPEKPVEIRAMIHNLSDSADYELRICDYGNINGACEHVGGIFNPLETKKASYGAGFSVKSLDGRGTIPSISSNVDGICHISGIELEQNLAGPDSMIGRSLSLFEKDDTVPIACCVIGSSNPWTLLPEKSDD